MKLLLKTIVFDLFAIFYCYSQTYVAPTYQKWPLLRSYPACEEHLTQTPGFFSKTFSRNRVKIQDIMFNFNTTCDDIYSRGYYPQEPYSEDEAQFPIAFDFIFLERIFNVIYAPQNIYCYSIDSKASEIFRERMYNLASCFDNVIIPEEEFNVTSAGYNVSSAHLSCMRALYNHPNKWKYNHDVPLRTNSELVKVYKILNGSNDVFTLKSTKGTVDLEANWTFPNIHLFNDGIPVSFFLVIIDNLNWKLNKSGNPSELQFTKSFVSVSLTREMVGFLTETLSLTKLIEQLESTSPYGMDENFISTINSNDVIKAPGGFTTACLNRGFPVDGITRSAIWIQNPEECYSGKFRHSVCIYGIEDLHRISRLPQLFLNKMMPGYDYGLVMCHLETLYNRTYVTDYPYKIQFNDDYYASVPHVRYNAERQQRIAQNLTDYVDLIEFDCEHPYPKDYLY